MTSPGQAPTNDPKSQNLGGELEHITEEMYKKNFELADKNKTLAILRRIDEIILSTVTDINQIAQNVADTVATEAEFKIVAIFLFDKESNVLTQIAISKTELIQKIQSVVNKQFYAEKISLRDSVNIIAQVARERYMQVAHDLQSILLPYMTEEEITQITQIDNIKSTIIHPLIVRDEVIGILVISVGENEESLFQYQRDLIDRLVGMVGIAIDNALLYKRIQEANEKLKSLDKLKDEFVSLASHELRTPMTAIKSYLWLVLNQHGDIGTLTEKQRLYLERTYQSTERLIKLVNDMLNVSRIESGRLILKPVPTDIVQLATDAINDVLPAAQEHAIVLTVQKPSITLPSVKADPEKIKEIFINLIGNSLKFTPNGGNITISFEQEGAQIVTHVMDTGKGIKPEDMGNLFQKFGMIEGNYGTRPLGQGTGLGLYISKSIIELHGGKISVFSAGENKGTTFSFTLPIES